MTRPGYSTGAGPEVRIGDAEREQAVSSLGEHYLAGRLTKDEYDERASAAWAARTAAGLAPLFRDLPQVPQQPSVKAVTSTRERPRRRRRVRMFPLVVLFVLVMALTPLSLPWWGWLILGWLWFSGMFAGACAWGRRHS